jgi:hypothetical protein
MRRACVLSAAVLFSACSPSGFLTGTVEGDGIFVRDSIFVPIRDENGMVGAGALLLADQPDLCKSLRAGRMPRKTHALELFVLRVANGGLMSPVEGDYRILTNAPQKPGNYALGLVLKFDSSCSSSLAQESAVVRGGTVGFDTLDFGRNGVATGEVDVTVGQQGDELRGRFSAEICEAEIATARCG